MVDHDIALLGSTCFRYMYDNSTDCSNLFAPSHIPTSVPMLRLPNELLLNIFSLLDSSALLRITPTCHHLYDIILHILNYRLHEAATLQGSALLLECRQPCAQFPSGPLNCTFAGTTSLSPTPSSLNDATECYHEALINGLGQSRSLYNRYKPHRPAYSSLLARSRQPPGDIPGSRTYNNTSSDDDTPMPSDDSDAENEEGPASQFISGRSINDQPVIKTISLDSDELFTQLCTSASVIVKTDNRNLIYCYEVDKGVIRVWRNWLEKRVQSASKYPHPQRVSSSNSSGGGSKDEHVTANNNNTLTAAEADNILWTSPNQTTGLRFTVLEQMPPPPPTSMLHLYHHAPSSSSTSSSSSSSSRSASEDPPVTHHIAIEELLIRSSHQLLTLEKAYMHE